MTNRLNSPIARSGGMSATNFLCSALEMRSQPAVRARYDAHGYTFVLINPDGSSGQVV